MNILKTNYLGANFATVGFMGKGGFKIAPHHKSEENININDGKLKPDANGNVVSRLAVLKRHPNQKTIRVTKSIMDNSRMIKIDSIKGNIDILDFDIDNMVILLDNDKSGLIKVLRVGTDFDFIFLKDLANMKDAYINTYSFLTGEFLHNDDCADSEFVVQLLAYLYYGEITTKILAPKSKTRINAFTYISNRSDLKITFADTLWKQRISLEGFKVSGHFRLQPIGEGRRKRKLIWIEEFSKDGYNRKATRELTHNKI